MKSITESLYNAAEYKESSTMKFRFTLVGFSDQIKLGLPLSARRIVLPLGFDWHYFGTDHVLQSIAGITENRKASEAQQALL